MSAPTELLQRIARFHDDLPRIRRADYNETEVRVQFINPLFEALGWDMRDAGGRHEVRHEDRIHIGGKAKAPDYGFYLDGRRRFFVEAKKPAVDIDRHTDPAYQLRRYAWTAKLPLSVLTDFEEFAVYDTRVRPAVGDSPKVARLRYWRYTEYEDVWDEIAAVFSREAVLAGSLDAWAATEGGKKGLATVDAEFLKEIERWRDLLARNIALRNPTLDERGLNFAVQQTIDRLLFLRIAEDRGIEPYGRLRDLATGGDVYTRLFALFNAADARYNSGLFHFGHEKGRGAPDMLTPALHIDDKALKDIIRSLYEPVSPYEFSVFPADILGHVYEQFLGKVIRLSGKSAKIEEKPEVRKAGGVYYTPTYIVDTIVARTVGKLLEGHAADPSGPVSRLRVLDPACGSGSFLLGAYQYLLDWHLRGYAAAPSKWARGRNRTLYQTAAGAYHLTLAERKRILLDNLHGVDIDPQAVEVTKLSLLLKVLEDTPEALTGQLALLPERVLPDLGDNIKCGNSLIGPDFYVQPTLDLTGFPKPVRSGSQPPPDLTGSGKPVRSGAPLTDEAMLRINAFDWNAEFRDVMRAGGFDAVVGNPPYIRIQALKEWAPIEVEHYKRAYRAAGKGNYDIYVVFVERGLQLLNPRGRLGFILPHKFFNAKYGEPLRGVIAEGRHVNQIIHFEEQQVFSGATTYTCLLFLSNQPQDQFQFIKASDLAAWRIGGEQQSGFLSAENVTESDWNFSIDTNAPIIAKLKQMPTTLGDIAHIFVGTQTSADTVFVLDNSRIEGEFVIGYSQELEQEVQVEAGIVKPFLRGKEIRRYQPIESTSSLICPYLIDEESVQPMKESDLSRQFPLAYAYLKNCKAKLASREKGKFKGNNWYAFGYPKSMTLFQRPKLIVPDYNNTASFTDDLNGHYFKTGYGILVNTGIELSPYYILGLLNSKLLFSFLMNVGTKLRGGYVRFWTQFIQQLPIRTIDPTNPTDKASHDHMVALVERMLDLNKRLAAETIPHVRTTLQRQIDATDKQIDALVYGLYGLTGEEIGIVEGG